MKLEDSIKREDEKMVGTILATFLELGTGGNSGAFALGENLQKFFTQVLESYAHVIAGTINRCLIPNLIKMNFGDTVKQMPQLVFSGITEKAGKEFMEILTGFTSSGVVGQDEMLEDHVRKMYNLPKKVEGTVVENGGENGENDNEDDSIGDNVDDSDADNEGDDDNSGTQLSVMKFAEAKTAKGLIDQQAKPTLEIMQSNLKFIGEKLIADITKNYKKLSESNKLNAVDNLKIGGVVAFKKQLRGVLNVSATKSLDMVENETGIHDVKLKDDIEVLELLEKYPSKTIKFAGDDKLPKHSKKLVQLQSSTLAEKMATDLQDIVTFAYIQNEQKTNDIAVLQEEMNAAAKKYQEGSTVNTASITSTSTIVNQTRNEFFFAPEVIEQIYAFRFNNSAPKAAICKTLTGQVFATDDTKFFQYSPPLHFNCKSYLSAIMQTAKSKPEIEKLPELGTAEQKSKTLSESIDNLVNLKHN